MKYTLLALIGSFTAYHFLGYSWTIALLVIAFIIFFFTGLDELLSE